VTGQKIEHIMKQTTASDSVHMLRQNCSPS